MSAGQFRISVTVAALAAMAAVIAPSSVAAQEKVEIIPALGFYLPLGGWTDEQDNGTGLPLRRQLSALVFSARLSVPISRKLDIEGNVAVTPSQVAYSTMSGTTDIDGGVYIASARAAYKLVTLKDGPTYDRAHWDLITSIGLGVVHRGGPAWQDISRVTAPVVLLGTELGVGLFRLSIDDYVSWGQFNSGRPNATRPRIHHDVIFSLGLTLRVGGR